ncbi:MAG: LolA family protein [Candidatus Acidiferrales bacterium]
MPRRAALVCLLALLASGAAAQEVDTQAVIGGVERRYNRATTLEAEFVQRYTSGANTLVESGRVFFQKGGRMRWEYRAPDEKLFLTDGDFAYLYVPQDKQVRRQGLKQAPEWQAAFALLVGRIDLRKQFDRVLVTRVHHLDSPARWQLRGTPRSDKQPFTEIWFDLNDAYQVLRIEVRQRDGSLIEFHFRDWRENRPLDPDLFRLSVPPGTAWVDESGS